MMSSTDKYFWEIQTTWYIQDNTSANYFLILCKINNLQYTVFPEDYFYRIIVEGKTDNLLKLKSDWNFRKSVNDPINISDYLIAKEDASRVIESYETIIVPDKVNDYNLRIIDCKYLIS